MKKKSKKRSLPFIINASGSVSVLVRIRDVALTIMLWALYIYLLHDFFIFLGDVYHWLHDGTGAANAYPKLRIFKTVEDYSEWIGLMAVVFIGWALYNRIRFARKTRRKASTAVTAEEIGNFSGLDPHDLKKWQKARSVTVHQDHKGHVVKVEVHAVS